MKKSALISLSSRKALACQAHDADSRLEWPAESWSVLGNEGVPAWAIPKSFGGMGLDARNLLEGYACIASECLTTSFILSQREAAVRRIMESENTALRDQLLTQLALGTAFATVGLSQLTTSRQHLPQILRAWRDSDAFVIDGAFPWVTSAELADWIVIGANLLEGGQILVAIPRESDGVEIGTPMELMALQGSLTAEVRFVRVRVDPRWLLKGPIEKVMGTGRGGTGSLETSCLALGLADAAIDYLEDEAKRRPELVATQETLQTEHQARQKQLFQLAEIAYTPEQAIALRTRTNMLVLRATQASLTAAKGAGFLLTHPAQRWARQALFFLVWSCPRPAVDATLAYLAGQSAVDDLLPG